MVDAFEAEALYQHTTAYEVLLNVQSIIPTNLKNAFKSALSTVLKQPTDRRS